MKNFMLAIALVAAAALVAPEVVSAQDCSDGNCGGYYSGGYDYGCGGASCASGGCGSRTCYFCKRWGFTGGGAYNEAGEIMPADCCSHPNFLLRTYYSKKDKFSPNPHYAYSLHGIEAGHTHEWNRRMANQNPWHDNYEYWRWGAPTALVVPPTAAFQSHYAWGVGQTQSRPIYHQFGMGGGAFMTGGGEGLYNKAPYWPTNTDQYGVYPVRAPF